MDETTAVLLKVCGPDKRYQHYWDQYKANNQVAPIPGLDDLEDPDFDGEALSSEEAMETLAIPGSEGLGLEGSALDNVETQQPEIPESAPVDGEHAEDEAQGKDVDPTKVCCLTKPFVSIVCFLNASKVHQSFVTVYDYVALSQYIPTHRFGFLKIFSLQDPAATPVEENGDHPGQLKSLLNLEFA